MPLNWLGIYIKDQKQPMQGELTGRRNLEKGILVQTWDEVAKKKCFRFEYKEK